jgi:kynurenine formamidase
MNRNEMLETLAKHSNWDRWGPDDQRGTLNLISRSTVTRTTGLVDSGIVVSCARQIAFGPRAAGPENGMPPLHFMQASGETAHEGEHSAFDWVGLPLHGMYVTHLDAPSHVFWDRKGYNNFDATDVSTTRGAAVGSIELAGDGIVARGVLLDVPLVRSTDSVADDDAVQGDDLVRAEELAGVTVAPGDIVLVRTGYGARRDSTGQFTGLSSSTIAWLSDRSPSVVGSDVAADPTAPEGTEVKSPVHLAAIVGMGMWIMDNCDLEELSAVCRRLGRWEFMCVIAPLRLKNCTGSPVNPIAIF